MRKLCRPLRRLFLSVLLGMAALICLSDLAMADPACLVTGLRGTATLEHGGARSSLTQGAAVEAGDTIITDAGSRVKLHFADGSELRLGENARLQIEMVKIDPAAGTRNILLRLPMGLLRAAAAKLKQSSGSSFEIHTGVAYSAVRGTEWIVVAREAETRVYVQEGRVAVGADFATSQFPKLVETERWVQVTRKSGIGPVQATPAGALKDLVEQTEASIAPDAAPSQSTDTTETAANPASDGTGEVSDVAGAVTDQATSAVAKATNAVTTTVNNAVSTTTETVTSTITNATTTVTNAVTTVTNNLPGSGTGSGSGSGGSSSGGSASGGSSSGGSSSGGSGDSSSGSGSASSSSSSGSGSGSESSGSSSGSGKSITGSVRDALGHLGL